MNEAKAGFLRNRFIPLLQNIPTESTPVWGKMTVQQMIEHFTDSVRIASSQTVFTEFVSPPEILERSRAFMLSEKPFRENTRNPLLPETPAPVRNPSKEAAVKELQQELQTFFTVFEENKLPTTRNPFFGDLNFDQNIHLLYKHALHHLRQFGVGPS